MTYPCISNALLLKTKVGARNVLIITTRHTQLVWLNIPRLASWRAQVLVRRRKTREIGRQACEDRSRARTVCFEAFSFDTR